MGEYNVHYLFSDRRVSAPVVMPSDRRSGPSGGGGSGRPLNLSSERSAETDEMGDKDDVNVCVVCMDRPIETVFLECGHLACCRACAAPMQLCPICRRPIARVVQTFRP